MIIPGNTVLPQDSVSLFVFLSFVSVSAKMVAENGRHSQRVNRGELNEETLYRDMNKSTGTNKDGDAPRHWQY